MSIETDNYAILYLYVNKDNQELIDLYKKHIENHNKSVYEDSHPNSGFDIFFPEDVTFDLTTKTTAKFVNFNIKCEMTYVRKFLHIDGSSNFDTNKSAFYVFPRSSISKTPLMLANHTGIIDSGYRGWIIGAFRNIDFTETTVEKNTRLLQICHPSLCPIRVEMVEEDTLTETTRGSGGFGSTGTKDAIK